MKVIVVAAGSDIVGGGERGIEPAELRWTLDRPFVQHVVETLVDGGAREIHFVLGRRPEIFEEMLGDGRRWGGQFHHHLARDPVRPYEILRTVPITPDERVLLCHADSMVLGGAWREDTGGTRAYVWKPEDDHRTLWTGWAWMTMGALLDASSGQDRNGVWSWLAARCAEGGAVLEPVGEPLQTRDSRDFHRSVRRILDGEHQGLLLYGHQARPGVWMERNVRMDPSAELVPPVYLGENSHVGAGARVGPGAAIGTGSFVDRRAVVLESLVLPGTYVGEGVEVERSIADRESLINLELGATVSVPDDMLLGGLESPKLGPSLSRLCFRAVALLILLVATPVLAMMRLAARAGQGAAARSRAILALPAPLDPHRWRVTWVTSFMTPAEETGEGPSWAHFLHGVMPGLPAVVLGRVDLIGLPMRHREEVHQLDREWRALYLGGRAGLISERLVEFGEQATPEQSFAAEAVYMARRGLLHDLRILLRYVGQVLGLVPRPRLAGTFPVVAERSAADRAVMPGTGG